MAIRKIYDVAVVGAGPVGLMVAKLLAEQGYQVVLLEKKRAIGENVVCAGIVGTEVIQRFDLPRELVITDVREATLLSPAGRTISYAQTEPFAHVIDRQKLEYFLLQASVKHNAEVRLGCNVANIEIGKNFATLTTNQNMDEPDSKIRAKIVVLATGVEVELCKKLGLGYPRSFLNTAQKLLLGDSYGRITVLTGSKISKGGFGWIVPYGQSLIKVGLMTSGSVGDKFLNLREKVSGKELSPLLSKRIPQGLVSKTFRERVVSVGGCAGQIKTTTGGGIYFGFICSHIASEVVSEALKRGVWDSSVLSKYEQRWKDKIGNEIKIGLYLRRIWSSLTNEQIEKLFTLIRNDGIFDLISGHLHFDWHVSFLFSFIRRPDVGSVLSLLRKKF
ncbi:MAG: NAD(P)/FAD-dependent oxidoreductase [Deltaproteobacteria bacterium]|nr:NAD(P)/FAD-dependent oxidoreductase [Deltaproteobacteria bacterium]